MQNPTKQNITKPNLEMCKAKDKQTRFSAFILEI